MLDIVHCYSFLLQFVNFIKGTPCVMFLWYHTTYVAGAVRLPRPSGNGTVASWNARLVMSVLFPSVPYRTQLNWTVVFGGNLAEVRNVNTGQRILLILEILSVIITLNKWPSHTKCYNVSFCGSAMDNFVKMFWTATLLPGLGPLFFGIFIGSAAVWACWRAILCAQLAGSLPLVRPGPATGRPGPAMTASSQPDLFAQPNCK